jgi:hypothetical protein
MARIHQLISEIGELKQETHHRAVLKILGILENNKALFRENMDPDYLNLVIKDFAGLCDTPPRDHQSPSYIREYQRCFDSLMFHLNRII